MLTDTEVGELLAADKVITANLGWHSTASRHSEAYSLEATVLAPAQNATLKLVGRKGKANRSFALIYKGEPIKKSTVHRRHTNPRRHPSRCPAQAHLE